MFKASYSYEKQFYDMQIIRLQNILDGKETLTYMSADTGEIIETKSLREKDIKRINEKIQEYKDLISESNSKLKRVDELNAAYKEAQASKFYPILSSLYSVCL